MERWKRYRPYTWATAKRAEKVSFTLTGNIHFQDRYTNAMLIYIVCYNNGTVEEMHRLYTWATAQRTEKVPFIW